MIRFLQTPGPVKKIVLGGILLVICVMMVITLIPGGGFLNDMFGGPRHRIGSIGKSWQSASQPAGSVTAGAAYRQAAIQGAKRSSALMPYLMQRAAQGIITQKALVYEADRMGLNVSDEELRTYLHQGRWDR